jgi:hypothetical protein
MVPKRPVVVSTGLEPGQDLVGMSEKCLDIPIHQSGSEVLGCEAGRNGVEVFNRA